MKQTTNERPNWTRQILMGMPVHGNMSQVDEKHSIALCAPADLPFLPKGLFVWGAKPMTFITQMQSGNCQDLNVSYHPVPARYFETGRTFEELKGLADANDLEHALDMRQMLEGIQELHVGTYFRIQISGPFENIAVWGLTYDGEPPPIETKIEWVPGDGDKRADCYRGTIRHKRLSGERLIQQAEGPTETGVAQLLIGLHTTPVRY